MLAFRLSLGPTVLPGKRLAILDELRGFALVLVLLYHSSGVLDRPNFVHGEIGVDIFLIVSGLALALTSTELPLRQFALRRFLRIYPAYWAALGLFLYTHRKYFAASYSVDNVVEHILGVHAYSHLGNFSAISDSFWFVSMIVGAYLVFVCIRNQLANLSLLIGLCGILTTIAVVTYQHFNHAGGLISLAVRIPSFFAGLIAGRLLAAGTAEIRLNWGLAIGLGSFYYLTFFRDVACTYTLPAIGLIAVWAALRWTLGKAIVGRVLFSFFSLLGAISYEVYLFHQPLIRDYNKLFIFQEFGLLHPSQGQLEIGILAWLAVTVAIAIPVHLATKYFFSSFGQGRPFQQTKGL